jgi:chorismate dehydratase
MLGVMSRAEPDPIAPAAPAPPGTLRVGSVPYLVARPLNLGLEREPGIELSFDVPATLSAELRAGRLDVALVSSIELFRHAGSSYLPGLGVCGEGYVSSVQLFLHTELEDVRSVALDPASRTAQTLVQVLAAEDMSLPRGLAFHEVPLGVDPRTAPLADTGLPADAFLRIGDRALAEHLTEGLAHYNPSAAWAHLTGLPFVFAAWIARAGIDLEPHRTAFERAATRGAEAATRLAREAAADWRLDPAVVEHYLTEECHFRIDPTRQAAALEAFGARARRLGLA